MTTHTLITAVVCAAFCSPASVKVWDGDTIRVGAETIRIVNIDAPEIGDKARCSYEAQLADSWDPYETIGFNNLGNTDVDEWQFAGWDWHHDCFTDGRGEVIGWLPFEPIPSGSPAAQGGE